MLAPPEAGSALPFRAPRLGWWLRILLVVIGLVPVSLLVTAGCLNPESKGLGTHQQLGLPPCSLRVLAGIRCPSCGMTTSWSHMMRGHVLQSFASNSGGALLALATLVGGPWALFSGLRGRWLGGMPNEWWFAGISVGIMAVTLTDWGIRLYLDHGR
jgi:hypothetical protein